MSGGIGEGERLRPLRGLALGTMTLLALVAVADAAAVVVHLRRAGELGDLPEESLVEGPLPTVEDATSAVEWADSAHLFAFAALVVTFILWQWRHAQNAQALGARDGLGPRWAVGGWFVPLANLVLPAVQLSQSSRASDADARRSGRPARPARVIVPWAIALGLGAILWTAGVLMTPSTDDDGNFVFATAQDVATARSSDLVAAAGFASYAVAAVLAVVMVRTLTARQASAHLALLLVPDLVHVVPELDGSARRRSATDRDIDEAMRTGVWRWSTRLRLGGAAAIAFCLFLTIGGLVDTGEAGYLLWGLIAVVLAWLIFWPRVALTDERVCIRNLFRRPSIAWSDIARVEVDHDEDEGRRLFVHTTAGRKVRILLGDHSFFDPGRRNRSDELAREIARRAADRQHRPVEELGGPRQHTADERAAHLRRAGKRGFWDVVWEAIGQNGG